MKSGNGTASPASRRTHRDAIGGALEEWLPEVPGGTESVRAQLARRLAAQLDDPRTAAYIVPKLSAELRAVLTELEGVRPGVDFEQALRILEDVRP